MGYAQDKGTITGTVTDLDMNDEPMPFATIMVKGTDISTNSDENGKYTLEVPAGTHTITFDFVGYQASEVEATLAAGETKTINQSISQSSVTLEEVVLTATRKKNTETALVLEMKEAKQVVSAISAEQISKSADGNAAEAMQRVPGVTIVDGRFVMIRGLSQRYNNVLLNNSLAPSTEVDKRTFSFDLIPTSSLDKMVIYKTGAADMPGDFSGGIIAITTSESATEFTSAEVGFGYRSGTSFDSYMQSEGSDTDWLGFDGNYRSLPDNFPDRNAINSNAEQSVAASNSLPNNFNPTEGKAFLDNSIGISLGRNIPLKGDNTLFTTNSLSYSNSFLTYKREFNRYFSLNEGETRPQEWLRFQDNTYLNETRITALSNWILRVGERSKFKFKNLFNQIGEEQTIIRNGFNFQQRGDDNLRNYYLGYQSRSIYVGQLEGEHNINSTNRIEWVVGINYLAENEPDLRRFRTYKPADSASDNYTMIDPPSSNLFDTGRYYGNLSELTANHGLNYTHTIERIKDNEDMGSLILKTGYYFDYRKRDFSSRYLSYLIPGYVPFDRAEELRNLPLTNIFSNENVNATNGWVMREGTRPIDSYDASNMLTAGYIKAEVPLYKFDISGGVRVEHNIQELNSRDDFAAIKVNNPITSILPSLNIGYNLSENSLLRLAYSRTVNRPEFREIAPFLFYDYVNDAANIGNPDLETATIDNVDFRYEYYPSKGETVSLGAFYKKFDKPIENVTQITTEQPQFFYANADNAYNYGVELELRKSLQGLTDNPFIDRLSANLNASYIVSRVDLGSDVVSQDRERALQGQSPYIINAALGYQDENDFSVNMIYNRYGNRIFSVGDVLFPTIYELSRDHIDLAISKKVNKTTFKLAVQDLLNAKYRFYEDTNRDEKITMENDNVISSFRRGTHFSLNIAYNF